MVFSKLMVVAGTIGSLDAIQVVSDLPADKNNGIGMKHTGKAHYVQNRLKYGKKKARNALLWNYVREKRLMPKSEGGKGGILHLKDANKLLKTRDIDFNWVGPDGKTALEWAYENRDVDTIDVLLKNGAIVADPSNFVAGKDEALMANVMSYAESAERAQMEHSKAKKAELKLIRQQCTQHKERYEVPNFSVPFCVPRACSDAVNAEGQRLWWFYDNSLKLPAAERLRIEKRAIAEEALDKLADAIDAIIEAKKEASASPECILAKIDIKKLNKILEEDRDEKKAELEDITKEIKEWMQADKPWHKTVKEWSEKTQVVRDHFKTLLKATRMEEDYQAACDRYARVNRN